VEKLWKGGGVDPPNAVERLWRVVEGMRERLAVATLLILMGFELGIALLRDGLTVDELVYIGSGYRHWEGDYRLNPEQPPLAKLMGALPLRFLKLRAPLSRAGDSEWGWSYRFVQEENNPSQVVAWARAPTALLTLSGAFLLWAWIRRVHGPGPALVGLSLTAFDPSVLAHGHLLTTDLPGTFAMVAASGALWAWCRAPTPFRGALVGLAIGVAVATRLTGLLLLPTMPLLAGLLRLGRGGRQGPTGRQWVVLWATVALVVPLVVWASYGFRYAPWPSESVAQPPTPWTGAGGRLVGALEARRWLPEAFLEGARLVLEHNALGHPTYLLGRLSNGGWPHYYLVAFLVKSTPGFLLGIVLAGFVLWKRRISWRLLGIHVLLPGAVLFLAASAGRIQIGERYILPARAYAILLFSCCVPALFRMQWGRLLVGAVLAFHALPSLAGASAGYLAYFNFLAGGEKGADRVLLDSNLDWGQDLPRLADWMKEKGVGKIQLAYHGSDDPSRYGISHEDLPGLHLYPARQPARPFSGVVAVGPSLLHGLFHPADHNPYADLLRRPPSDRAGVFFVYVLAE